jgi:hypothetical protein
MAKEQTDINEFEVIRFRCTAPKNGRFGVNGYLRSRVFIGQETEIPRWHPVRDPEKQVQLVDEKGNLRWRENKTPTWGEFICYDDRTPRRPSQTPQKVGGTTKNKPTMRASDMPVGN